ncbi:MAG: NotI family restriction endonuclease [Chloroflexota bacterium]|nr:NotI family restriction endonuclease [Chloroflexota bacterium]
MNKVLELYGISTRSDGEVDWASVLIQQFCPYLGRKCAKNRKSNPDVTIGTCSVEYGRERKQIMICPYRFLERNQVFLDCIHLLTLHEPGNELHIVPEVGIPGGNVDYFLVSALNGQVKDFVGVELQTIDTTGTVWPERQRFLDDRGVKVNANDVASSRKFGMNWKMTSKTILVQLHHKVETLEGINKHLVLVAQEHLFDYMRREFQFEHIKNARLGDSMHFHTYRFAQSNKGNFRTSLDSRYSTDADGIAISLGLSISPKVELKKIIAILEEKISDKTLIQFQERQSRTRE